MRHKPSVYCCFVLLSGFLASTNGAQKNDSPVIIVITNAGYVEEGEFKKTNVRKQEKVPVQVRVGQKIIWKNTGTDQHSAVSVDAKTGDIPDNPLFQTDLIKPGKTGETTFTLKMFEMAQKQGYEKKEGGFVIPYICEKHPKMTGKLHLIK